MKYFLKAAVFETSFGWCSAVECNDSIIRITLPSSREEANAEIDKLQCVRVETSSNRVLNGACDAIRMYLAGESSELDFPVDIKCVALEAADLAGGYRKSTPFQRDVWNATRNVDPGTVKTYGDLARAVGRPRTARAVGNALAKNPLPLIVPCHRIIASNGCVGGFGGGLELKMRLLELEGAGGFVRRIND